MRPRLAAISLICAALLLAGAESTHAQDSDPVHIRSDVTYDLSGEGAVAVSWDVTIDNNDPTTAQQGNGGPIAFYDSVSIPFLRGAESVEAFDSDGTPLGVTVDEADATVIGASVSFAQRLFYEETYSFALTYELPQETREESLLITPAYIFLPIIASGDEAAVSVILPPDGEWKSVLEPEDCETDGLRFVCAGSESAYLVATAEASRPEAVSSFPLSVELGEQTLALTVTYFEGDEAFAEHLAELIPAALPIVEERYGFPYDGAREIEVSQGGRQAILGYEGLTSCDESSCEIVISPIADDVTIIHELAHLWSDIYAERWLSEGFAQLVAEETVAALPPDLVRGEPPVRRIAGVDLQLDQWGDVSSVIGADEDTLAIEGAGYDLSLRFLETLRFEIGSSTLRDVNAAISASSEPVDSRRYIDLVEEVSGRDVDQLFATWVFPTTYEIFLESRREARDRLSELEVRALVEDLPEGAMAAIREDVEAWRFQSALSAMEAIDADVARYNELSADIIDLASDASALGLSFPSSVAESLDQWEFEETELALAGAGDAIDAYRTARETVSASRDLWERFGLIGSDPDGQLSDAADSFAAGQFQTSIDESNGAAATIDDAPTVALRRVLIVAGIFAAFAAIVLAAVWASLARERELADR